MIRCSWVPTNNLDYQNYHDAEWGVPVYDDRLFFEFLILEGAQAGLSWETVLKKRSEYQSVFYNFEVEKVAKIGKKEMALILQNPGIIRNKLKVQSAIKNAQVVLQIQKKFGSFSNYLWSFVGGKPIIHSYKKLCLVPVQSTESVALSQDLKKRGCSFVGPTIMYAFMQATGMVMDHTTHCFRYSELS